MPSLPPRLRPRALALLAAGCAAPVVVMALPASSAVAQQAPTASRPAPQRAGEVMGLRYLSWSGKAAGPASAAPAFSDGLRRPAGPPASSAPASLTAAADTRSPGIQSMARPSRYGPGTGSTGLTPASTWTGRMPASASAPLSSPPQRASAPTAPPVGVAPVYATQAQTSQSPANPSDAQDQADMQAQIQAQYQAWYQQEAQAQYQAQYQAQVEAQMQAAPQLRQQPPIRVQAPQAPEPALAASADGYQQRADAPTSPPAMPQTQTPAPLAADPMAPRRDARIFQMQRPPDASSTAPASNDAARTQAPTPAPNQVQPQAQPYNGQAYASAGPPREGARYYSVHRAEGRQPDPITMPESVYAPMDLAEPPAQPVQTRNVNGRLQAVVPNADPSLP